MRIDAHQHFWRFDPIRDGWITEEMLAIRRDFLPADLLPVLQHHGIDGTVLVQASQLELENDFMLTHASEHSFIKGIVGWVDLCADNAAERLAHYRSNPKMKGFRHVLQGEADRAFMLRPAFLRGIGHLQKHGFTYDILIYADQLPYVLEMVKQFPSQPFVIDHLAKPNIRAQQKDNWKFYMKALGACSNVHCKVSGMVTEADWYGWKESDFHPYLDAVVDAFGADRLMFGSDWPVCLIAADYARMLEITDNYFSRFNASDRSKFYGENACRFYGLEA